MAGMVGAKAKRAPVVLLVALLVLALALLVVWRSRERSDGAGRGPLKVKAGNTELVFPAPPHNESWAATVGGLLLCSPGQQTVTLTGVVPRHGLRAESVAAVTRAFEIQQRKQPLVGEPAIGGCGTPPWIGGIGHPHENRLVGAFQDVAGGAVVPPSCERTTSAPGEKAVELLVTLTAGGEGATFDGLTVEYTLRGEKFRTAIPVQVTLCGTGMRNADC